MAEFSTENSYLSTSAWFSRNGPSGQFHNETIAQPLPNIRKKTELILSKTLNIALGFILGLVFLFFGFVLANYAETGFFIVLSIISTPIIGYKLYQSKYKSLGLGILIFSIPGIIIGLLFWVLTNLH